LSKQLIKYCANERSRDERTHAHTDGQPESIMPPAPNGGGDIKICYKMVEFVSCCNNRIITMVIIISISIIIIITV